jgi:hypothetical protein
MSAFILLSCMPIDKVVVVDDDKYVLWIGSDE